MREKKILSNGKVGLTTLAIPPAQEAKGKEVMTRRILKNKREEPPQPPGKKRWERCTKGRQLVAYQLTVKNARGNRHILEQKKGKSRGGKM